MLRNTDRPELLIWSSPALLTRPETAPLLTEALEMGTALALVSDSTPRAQLEATLSNALDAKFSQDVVVFSGADSPGGVDMPFPRPSFPSPACLSALRRSIEVAPDTYGGLGGFGSNNQVEPARSPMSKWCVCV